MRRMPWGPAAVLFCVVPTPFAAAQPTTVLRPREIIVNFDPIIESRGKQRLHTVAHWNSASTLTVGYVGDLEASSHGLVAGRITRTINADVFPLKADGFRYTDGSYMECYQTWSGWHQPDGVDYKAIARDYDLARKVDSGEIDEVFIHGAPYFGYWESTMAGRGGYWCNSGPQRRIACSRIFIMMGFNYERGVGEMLEDYGHRTESILWHVYGSWQPQKTHAWNRFTLYDKVYPGEAACGNVHYAPNSQGDYDWGNETFVWSTCDDWLYNYPNLTGLKKWVNRTEWGGGDMRLHHTWWFARMPHVAGATTEYGMTRLNNWWAYMQDFNSYAESGGDHLPGGPAPPAEPFPVPPVAITANAYDDWAPRINAAGRVVWHGFDGADFEIYSANADGSNPVRITNNTYSDEDPRINALGRIGWQAFDGADYEIFSANADGTGLVQITNNTLFDAHPEINDAGRIVWESFDGLDYEIYSARADGSEVVRVTNNAATFPARPLDDVWPHINNADRVVWAGYSGSNWQVYSANADGTGLVNVSGNSYENEYPRINDAGRVVWHAWLNDTNGEIYSASATGGPVVRLTNNTVEDWYPDISADGHVVWMARFGGDWEIMQASALGGAVTAVTSNSTHDQYPRINSSGQIAWQGFDGHDWEIYLSSDGHVYQVTQNDYDDRAVQLNDALQMVWHAGSAGGAAGDSTEIVAALPSPVVPGDADGDGDVDLSDFGRFQRCLTVSTAEPPAPGCERSDLDRDNDIDQADVVLFLGCLSGANVAGDPACAS